MASGLWMEWQQVTGVQLNIEYKDINMKKKQKKIEERLHNYKVKK
jgi:hypothetical protein